MPVTKRAIGGQRLVRPHDYERGREMNLYAIRREKAWQSPEDLETTAARSKQVADDDFPDDIAWIRSYVIKEDGGTLGTICIYQASSIEKVREHAKRVDMPADEILEIADTVIIRPDPEPAAAT
jgi:sporulation protein YlmC with PRC-barrel domain